MLKWIITKFPAVQTFKFWLIAALVSAILGAAGYFVYDYRQTLQELAVAEQQVADLEEKVDTVNAQIKDERKRTQDLRKDNSKINSQYLNTIRELNQMKENYETLKNDPSEAEIKINASFNNYMDDVSCITGDSNQCPE